ncbi:hypothetical protein BKA69DRAFT_1038339 [Paraphysoderma sedebokerense]|nr:hypothetical protein BKA69DRAFT_1038339 [Paraphysoderma sedebokerense]
MFLTRVLICLFFLFITLASIKSDGSIKQAKSNYIIDDAKKHLEEELNKTHTDYSQDDEQYYFFLLHDYDEDEKLDVVKVQLMDALFLVYHHTVGCEMRAAFTDYEYDADTVKLKEITDMIDHVLDEDDLDNDGKISWEEYLASQKYHEAYGSNL